MTRRRWFGVIAAGFALAVAVALLSPLASSEPDGLERVAEDKAFSEEAKDPSYNILPDYTIPGIENETVTTILSGIIGIAVVAAVCYGLVFLMRAASKPTGNDSPS